MTDGTSAVAAQRAWRAELTRKAIHVATAALPIAWALDLVTTAVVRTTLAGALGAALAVEVLRRAHAPTAARFERAFGALLRSHERHAITGATWLAGGMALAAWLAPREAAIAALWAAATGDAAAALVGSGLSAWRGRRADGKTLAGSMAALAVTALGVRALLSVSWTDALLLGAVAAAAEWPRRPLDDNLRITVAVALAASLLLAR